MRRVILEHSKSLNFQKGSPPSLKSRKIEPCPSASFLIHGKHPVALLKKSNTQKALRSLVERYQVPQTLCVEELVKPGLTP